MNTDRADEAHTSGGEFPSLVIDRGHHTDGVSPHEDSQLGDLVLGGRDLVVVVLLVGIHDC